MEPEGSMPLDMRVAMLSHDHRCWSRVGVTRMHSVWRTTIFRTNRQI